MPSVRVPTDRLPQLAAAAIAALMLGIVFQKTFTFLYVNWHREEYSHGFLVPPISAFLLWQRRALLKRLPLQGSWLGFGIVLVGLSLFFLNFFATINGADAYALVIVIAGFTLAALGWQGFRVALVPIALLLLMNPLPTFWYNHLSSELQLISSQLGVAVMRAFGVSVFLEGNVIDLGNYKLQVAEACSGLRYLFPLMTLGAVVAYVFKGRLWTRWCVFLSTIPITVLMNSLRIGLIGILVDRFGIQQAEGFLHQFEGWAIFMGCLAVLLLESWLLLRLSGDRRSLREVVDFALPVPPGAQKVGSGGAQVVMPAVAAAAVLLLAAYPAQALPQRTEILPARTDFSAFPAHLGAWVGRREPLEQVYLDVLQLDDYLLADFTDKAASTEPVNLYVAYYASQRAEILPTRSDFSAFPTHMGEWTGARERLEQVYLDELQLDDYLLADFSTADRAAPAQPVNLYVAYYASQRTGRAVHSPSSCLPGGGWRIEQFEQRNLPGVRPDAGLLRVNRAVISQGTSRELVYYWFQERGRSLTSEYAVKWYLLTDAMTRDRTDGALVRLITPLRPGEDAASGDARLRQFSAVAVPLLHPYLPD